MYKLSLTALLMATTAMPLAAQDSEVEVQAQTDTKLQSDDTLTKDEIVVTAMRIRGSVETAVPPIDELDEADIMAVGASSLTELLEAVSPQTGSGRGRGGGQPVILLNGQRISGFRELRDLPPEAVRKVEIFPEEVALQYGFRPDQRVVNIILKENFASFIAEVEHGQPEKGGQSTQEVEGTFTQIGKSSRLNIDFEYETVNSLIESERDIISTSNGALGVGGNITGIGTNGEIDPALSALAGSMITQAGVPIGSGNPTLANFATTAGTLNPGDVSAFRTLIPASDRFEVNATWSRSLGTQSNFSINGNYSVNDSTSLLGLPGESFVLPASSPFSPFAQDVTVNRYFDGRALTRNSETHSAQFGGSFNTLLNAWRWSVTGDYALTDSHSTTFRNVDFAALEQAVLNGTANPFDAAFGNNLVFLAPDISDSTTNTMTLRSTLSGTPLTLPAGDVRLTLASGYSRNTLDATSWRSGITTTSNLGRDVMSHSANVDVPLVERGVGALGSIGDLSLNGNIGVSDVSDFGGLMEYGAGLRWSPAQSLSFSVSVIGDENAPSVAQLGNPMTLTPNVSVYDFNTGQTRFLDVISGGNPFLVAENRRDLKISANWQPGFVKGLGVQVEYFRNRSKNTTQSFPLLTPEIEAAFPDRVIRDSNGQLLSLDQRAVNFEEERSQRIRWGFNMSGSLGKEQQAGGAGALPPGRGPGAGGGGRGQGGGGGRGGGGARGGGGMMAALGGNRQSSRWQVALYHTYRIQDEILIRQGVPVLDLLDGSALSANGGSARHEIEFSGGIFHKGFGFRLQGTYKGGTRVEGSGLPGSSDLTFSDQTSLSAFLFADLGQQKGLVHALPFLKNSRLTLRVDNVLNDVVDVRDQNGLVPLQYQPGLLDPRGRVFELSFRRHF